MKELGIEEASLQFSVLLALVENGEEIKIARNGKVVAERMPPRVCESGRGWIGRSRRFATEPKRSCR